METIIYIIIGCFGLWSLYDTWAEMQGIKDKESVKQEYHKKYGRRKK